MARVPIKRRLFPLSVQLRPEAEGASADSRTASSFPLNCYCHAHTANAVTNPVGRVNEKPTAPSLHLALPSVVLDLSVLAEERASLDAVEAVAGNIVAPAVISPFGEPSPFPHAPSPWFTLSGSRYGRTVLGRRPDH